MDEIPISDQLLPSPLKIKCSLEKYRTFQCKFCGLGFKEINDLRNHLITTFEKTSICPTCNNVFSTVKGMKQHYGKLHSSHRPARCSQCKKRYRNKYALKFHIKQVHEQSTREECPNCFHSFYNDYSLKRHLKICKSTVENSQYK